MHNRAYFISMVAAALCCDLVLMMIALLNFSIEIVPGLRSGFDGPFNLVVVGVFILSIGAVLPLGSLLQQECRHTRSFKLTVDLEELSEPLT